MRLLTATPMLFLVPSVVSAQGVPVQPSSDITELCFTPPSVRRVPPIPASSELRKLHADQGVVEIQVVIDANGRIDHLAWVNGEESFRKFALSWAGDFLFYPGIANKQAQRSKAYICIRAYQATGQLQYSFGMSPTPTKSDWLQIPEQ